RGARLLPRCQDDRRPGRFRRRPHSRPRRHRPGADAALGAAMTHGPRLDGDRNYRSGTLEPDSVRTMFDRIAPVYDVMNHVMTMGLDRRLRRLTVEAIVQPGARVLDACCGTGDLAIAAEREGGIVTGLDFSVEMLARARRKSTTVEWVQGDLLQLPYADSSFDAATVGFGVRNVDDLRAALVE